MRRDKRRKEEKTGECKQEKVTGEERKHQIWRWSYRKGEEN